MSELFIMPYWECPNCHKENREDEYWELKEDDTMQCQHCENEYPIIGIDHVMNVTVQP